ncbi:MAG: MMPL family transporter, partial [Myxococcales bacterium]|nr:MMPL family transporter [Myxococcales bacterium]
ALAAAALEGRGRDALPRLESALDEQSPDVRWTACLALGGLGAAGVDVQAALVRCLGDAALAVRIAACWGAERLPPSLQRAQLEDALLARILTDLPPVRFAAARALASCAPAPPAALVAALTREAKDLTGVRPEMVTSLANAVHVEAIGDAVRAEKFFTKVPKDPVAIAAIRDKALSDSLIRGFLVSEDATTALIVAPVDRDTLPRTVYDETKAILDRFETPGFRLYMYGNYIVGQTLEYESQMDLLVFFSIGYGLIFFGLFVSFFHLRGLLLPAAVMAASVIWTMGLIGYVGQTMSTVSMLVPILLLAVASSYAIHMVHRFDEALAEGRDGALERAVDAIWLPIVLSGATTALGIVTLMVFKVSFIRDFGLWGSIGVLFATLLTLTLIPAGLALVADRAKAPHGEASQRLDDFLGGLARFTLRRKRWIYGATAALIALSVIGILRIAVGVDPVSFFPKDHELREVDALFNRRFNGANYLQVMIQG